MFYEQTINSPLGELSIVSNGNEVIGVWMKNQKYFKHGIEESETVMESRIEIEEVKEWFVQYFEGKQPSISSLRLDPIGTSFQKEVWLLLSQIPYGQLTSYRFIASALAKKRGLDSMSAQAVGGAVAHNPLSIIIPCHRVVASNANLTGYAGGLDKKKSLLMHEGIDLNNIKAYIK